MDLGYVYNVQPMAPDDSRTRWFDAGALRIGVEARDLTPEELFSYYSTDAAGLEEIKKDAPFGLEDRGVSVHVVGSENGHEYLRFDLFDGSPHYHYIHGDGITNHIIPFDEVAHGPILDWSMDQLRHRLAPMLEEARASEVLAQIDLQLVSAVIDGVEAEARSVQEQLRELD
ncbi:hypothetical protein MK489_02810 [Myxococcota bacterium]|nr:hypothetical protein [Myxococcota bacterium]